MSVDSAQGLWLEGQGALRRGEPGKAAVLFQQSLQKESNLTQNHISLAAAHLADGNAEAACAELGRYLEAHPDDDQSRLYHAELLMKLGRMDEAGDAFEQTIARRQNFESRELGHLIHCHCRMFEISQHLDDIYSAHLHRGIGLLLLAQGRGKAELLDDAPSTESLLCKAAAELTEARALYPDEARPHWYLYRVWNALAQKNQASRWLLETKQLAPFAHLTPSERRALELTCRSEASLSNRD